MKATRTPPKRKFVGAYFVNCRVYGRLHFNPDVKQFQGYCPKCGQTVRIRSGNQGANVNFVEVTCR